MTNTAEKIRETVREDPGIHFNELVRSSSLAPGQIQYHLHDLIESRAVISENLYGRTHYYPPEYDDWERGAIALLRRETARDIIAHLMEKGEARPGEIATDVGIARSTLEWHLDHLIEQGLVDKEYDSSNRVFLSLSRPEETARLIREVKPTIPDRLVDRFMRLVDGLLEDV